jgi:hypothetical protein
VRVKARWALVATAALWVAAPALAQHATGSMGGGHASYGGHMSAGHTMGAHQHFDGRYAHNQYYYNHGYHSYTVPHGGYAVTYNGGHYYCYGGQWWGWHGGVWVVVGAPYGAYIPYLPPYYTAVWWGGSPYYYANDTYYAWSDADQQYQVVAPPAGMDPNPEVANPPAATPSGELFVYPRNGQSPEQIANDRYECHRWAAEQSGFDPSQTGGGVASEDAPAKRADYLRAQAACLDGRGYTVR